MPSKELALNALLQHKLMPLFYHDDAAVCSGVLQALYRGGVRLLEFTNRGENALANYKVLKQLASETMPGLMLGIGTIKTAPDAIAFLDADADFIVCPTINPEVASVVHARGLLWVPGCMTATEIALAEQCGASFVKLFPGNLLGPQYVSAIKDIFPALRFMPTGGTEPEEANLRSWFKSGVVAVGMGSKLITADMLRNKDYAGIEAAARRALELIAQVTAPPQAVA